MFFSSWSRPRKPRAGCCGTTILKSGCRHCATASRSFGFSAAMNWSLASISSWSRWFGALQPFGGLTPAVLEHDVREGLTPQRAVATGRAAEGDGRGYEHVFGNLEEFLELLFEGHV